MSRMVFKKKGGRSEQALKSLRYREAPPCMRQRFQRIDHPGLACMDE
jgi:hypothetical protein